MTNAPNLKSPDPKIMLKRIFELSAEVTKLGIAAGKTVGTAESCTGGLIGAALTAVPGSSAVFHGGIISYDNAVKMSLLNVPQKMLETHGAVSQPVAEIMAREACLALNVDMAISVTGIAGPGGGSNEKPVGTVWIGLAERKDGELITTTERHLFEGVSRNKVRDMTCLRSLETLIKALNS